MRIKSLTIDNVRSIEHLEFTDLPETGVVVIHGENESGKSTVMEAIHTVLTLQHGSKKAKALQPVGRDVAPRVELEASIGPNEFTVRKQWIRRPSSELTITAPVREQYTGREADQKLDAIIDENLDKELFNLLFMRQGELGESVEAAGIPALTRVLDSAEGAAGGAGAAGAESIDDSGLMAQVEEHYAQFWDKNGKPKKTLTALDTRVVEAEQAVAEATERKARLEGFVTEHAQKHAELAAIDDELPQAEEDLAAKQGELAEALKVKERAVEAKAVLDRATRDLQRANDDVEARAALRASVDAAAKDAVTLEEQLGPAQEKADQHAERLNDAVAARDEAMKRTEAARIRARQAEAALQRARASARISELGKDLKQIEEADTEVVRLVAMQPDRPVTDADVRELEAALAEVAVQTRLLDATSARLHATATENATIVVDDGQRELVPGGDEEIVLRDGTEIGIGAVRLRYRPAQGVGGNDAALRAAGEKLEAVAERVGYSDLDAARAARDDHAELAAALKAARARREDIVAGRETGELTDELRRFRESLAEHADSEDSVLSMEEAQDQQDQANAQLDEAREEERAAEARLEPLRENSAATELTVLQARVDNARATAASATKQLEQAQAKLADADLEAAQADAATARDAAVVKLDELTKLVDAANPDLLAQLADGASVRVDNLTRRKQTTRDRIMALGGYIDTAEGEAEKLAKAEAELEEASAKAQRERRKAGAVKLLRDTMAAHRDAARMKYAAPFADSLARYASRVFGPGVSFGLDDSLRVTSRTLGDASVDLKHLSGGAKEQMALLTRFAIADMIAQGSDEAVSVPVVIDDALGATDPRRLELMNALFTQAGQNAQVIVFTCFPGRFDRVAAALSTSIDDLKMIRD